MGNTKISKKNEYEEIVEFISTLQKEEQTKSEALFVQCKNIEHQIRQRELIYKEQEKRRNPNISMFSPLDTEDVYDDGIVWKEEIDKWKKELSDLEKKNELSRKRASKLVELESYITNVCKKTETMQSINEGIQINNEDISTKPEATSLYIDSNSFLGSGTKDEENKYREYSVKLLETQELDRNRIARDLHDTTVQSLTGLVHKTELCSKLLDIDVVRARLELQSMKEVIKTTIEDMREAIYDLRPMALNNLGLSAAIESLSTHIKKNHDIEIIIKVEGKEVDTPSIVRVTLYRIVQEACNNIIKHASATKVNIYVMYKEDKLQIKISDNGVGFDLKQLNNSQSNELYGFGLSTMKERADLLKGDFNLTTFPGKGTTVDVCVPILLA